MWKILAIAILIAPSLTYAETTLRSDDIVKFFRQQAANKNTAESNGEQAQSRAVFVQPSGYDKSNSSPADQNASVQSDTYNLLVMFDLNSDRLTWKARQNLSQFANALKTRDLSEMGFAIEGHTDARGPSEYNQELSVKRAEAVVRFLSDQGIARTRLEPKGYGESRPIAYDPYHPANRRVETRLID